MLLLQSVILAHHDSASHLTQIPSFSSPVGSANRESIESSQLCQQERHQQQRSSQRRYSMELELGLAPPSARHPIPKTIDHLAAAEDELSSTSSDHHPCAAARGGKRQFEEAFQAAAETTTLPLFDDGSSCGGRNGSSKRPLVGWPPVSTARSRACGGVGGAKYVKVKKEGDAIGRKVDLSLHASYDELLATLAHMFPTTTGNQDDKEISSSTSNTSTRHVDVVVTYEDGEGDWMLVGDVPWDDFARSVKRIKILG